ncbi:MAG: hypothetical protein WCB99_07560 [Candidatus Cybelea sp.]|jgi:hypothetical protein
MHYGCKPLLPNRVIQGINDPNDVLHFVQLEKSSDGRLAQDDGFAVETFVLPARVHSQHLSHAGSVKARYAAKINDDVWLVAQALKLVRPLVLASHVVFAGKNC